MSQEMTTDDVILYMGEQDKLEKVIDEYRPSIVSHAIDMNPEFVSKIILSLEGNDSMVMAIKLEKDIMDNDDVDDFKFMSGFIDENQALLGQAMLDMGYSSWDEFEDSDTEVIELMLKLAKERPNEIFESFAKHVPDYVLNAIVTNLELESGVIGNLADNNALSLIICKAIVGDVVAESGDLFEICKIIYQYDEETVKESYKEVHGKSVDTEYFENNANEFVNHIIGYHKNEVAISVGLGYSHLYRKFIREL
jgi:hypothetical protein